MLGSALVARLRADGERALGVDISEADLTREERARDLVKHAHPTHVIHCAAYTDVDGAESDAETCHRANALAPKYVARACANAGARMLMISTDYVFDGKATEPYPVDAEPNPVGVYARSKYTGEKAAAAALEDCQIVRTAWLYGPGRRNFVVKIRDLLARNGPLRVVNDQRGSPTYAVDLAKRLIALTRLDVRGIFHLTNSGHCTWCEFARKIAELLGKDPSVIQPVATAERPVPAPRPAWSVLDCSRALEIGLEPMRPWQEALADYLSRLSRGDCAG